VWNTPKKSSGNGSNHLLILFCLFFDVEMDLSLLKGREQQQQRMLIQVVFAVPMQTIINCW
jgi:hypothetical protein